MKSQHIPIILALILVIVQGVFYWLLEKEYSKTAEQSEVKNLRNTNIAYLVVVCLFALSTCLWSFGVEYADAAMALFGVIVVILLIVQSNFGQNMDSFVKTTAPVVTFVLVLLTYICGTVFFKPNDVLPWH